MRKKKSTSKTQALLKEIRSAEKLTAKDMNIVVGPCSGVHPSPEVVRLSRAAVDERIEQFRAARRITAEDRNVVIGEPWRM